MQKKKSDVPPPFSDLKKGGDVEIWPKSVSKNASDLFLSTF